MKAKNMNKVELAFTITNISIFGVCLIPIVSFIYLLWFLFLPVIGFSIYNFIVSKGTARRNSNLIILILAAVGVIPFIGYVVRAIALGFSIWNLTKRK